MKKRVTRHTLEQQIVAAAKQWAVAEAAIEKGFFNPIIAWETKATHAVARRNLAMLSLDLIRLERAGRRG